MKKVLIFSFILFVMYSFHIHGGSSDRTEWWLYNYGDYTKTGGKNDYRVKWVNEVFERVKNAADKALDQPPRLFIINNPHGVYALALPDGGIIINPKTLDICYKNADRKKGDQRMAFVLGHELAHLANKDFIHQEAFMFLERYSDKKAQKKLKKYFKLPEKETKELMADKIGACCAAMAGYDISKLFGKKNNFFQHWIRQTRFDGYNNSNHYPSFEKREKFIRTQLMRVVNQVELFRAGVLLYQVGNYHDGADAFREFLKIYPAREVLNNIGACYLSLALHNLHTKFSDQYYRFRLSTAIDYSTTAEKLNLRGEGDYLNDKDISRYISKAEDHFKRAVARDKLDRTCRYNLAAVLILKKEYSRAQAECDDILKKYPRDVNALNNKAIAFYYYGKAEDIDTTPKAIRVLEKAHRLAPNNLEVLYNLAAIKEARMRLAGAKIYWEKYLKLSTTPKDNFYKRISKKLKRKFLPKSGEKAGTPSMPGGIRLGENFSHIEEKWGKDNTREFKLGIGEDTDKDDWSTILQLSVKDHTRVLALDGTVELVERVLSPVQGIEDVLKKFGTPRKIIHHTAGNFYVYKDRGFSIKEINGKACSYTWFEKAAARPAYMRSGD